MSFANLFIASAQNVINFVLIKITGAIPCVSYQYAGIEVQAIAQTGQIREVLRRKSDPLHRRKHTPSVQDKKFLEEMEQVISWADWTNRIAPHYPVAGLGRKPFELEAMLRIHLMQQWFGYSDPGMEEALHDVPMLREFAGLDAGEDAMPDETTILKFRHLLEKHHLAQSLFAETTAQLEPSRDYCCVMA